MKRHTAVAIALLVLASGCGKDSPSTPTPPPPHVSEAHIVLDRNDLSVEKTTDGYRASGSIINTGPDCATKIAGSAAITFGGTVYPLPWALAPEKRLQVNERAAYTVCCLPLSIAGQTGSVNVTFTFDSVTCP